MAEGKVWLGLFDGYMSAEDDRLTSETKIGGVPTYLPVLSENDRRRIDTWTRCGVCGCRMFLILQAFSPLTRLSSSNEGEEEEEKDKESTQHPHHRMIYIFCCNRSSCATQSSSSWAAFSVQVDAEDEDAAAASRENEEEGGRVNASAAHASRAQPREALPPCSFPPCYVDMTEEPATSQVRLSDAEEALVRRYEARVRAAAALHPGAPVMLGGPADGSDPAWTAGGVKDLQDLQEAAAAFDARGIDAEYHVFRTRMERAPSQVLRYYERVYPPHTTQDKTMRASSSSSAAATAGQTSVYEASVAHVCAGEEQDESEASAALQPLFMNAVRVAQRDRLGRASCAQCGAALVHEVQLMPTALYYLRVHQYTVQGAASDACLSPSKESGVEVAQTVDGTDFATVTLYTCSQQCAALCNRGVHIRKEVVFVEEAPTLH